MSEFEFDLNIRECLCSSIFDERRREWQIFNFLTITEFDTWRDEAAVDNTHHAQTQLIFCCQYFLVLICWW